MAVGSVTSSTLQRDLITALRQTRTAAAQPVGANAFAVASQSSGTGATAASSGAASGSSLSSDLMASLLQVQSDASQVSAQGGFASSTDATGATDGSQASGAAARVHHHHGYQTATAASNSADPSQSAGSSTAIAADSTSTTGHTDPLESLQDGLQSLLQQVTKAIAAYAGGGPVGLAASTLTNASKA